MNPLPTIDPPPSNKELCVFFYGNTPHDNNHIWKCRCGKLRKQIIKQGYQNLMGHLKSHHPDHLDIFYMAQQMSNPSSKFQHVGICQTKLTYLVNAKSSNIFKWLEWIVMEEHELNFCEKKLTRKNTNLTRISKKTLKKYVFRLVRAVEKIITTAVQIASQYALIFDCRSEGGTQIIGLFVSCPGTERSAEPLICLLAFTYFLDETKFKASSHAEFIRSTLELYNLQEERLICLIGDKCSTNKLVSDLMLVPLVGCHSHRLNLAIEAYNKEHLGNDCEMHKMALNDFKSIKLKLQNRETTLSDSNVLFQSLIAEYPNFDFNMYLGANARIVHSSAFEIGIIKIQNSDQNGMSDAEKLAVKGLKNQNAIESNQTNLPSSLSFAERALKRKKLIDYNNDYINPNFVVPTSNDVERLFSLSKRMYSVKRRRSASTTLKALIFLKCNRDLWNLSLVGNVVNEDEEDEDKDDEKSDSENKYDDYSDSEDTDY